MKKISIIIPSWFTKTQHGKYGKNETYWFASKCLERLIEVTPKDSYELIIIDNGSTIDSEIPFNDERWHLSKEELYAYGPNNYWKKADVLIRNTKNLGFAPSCNQGFKLATGKYIVCLNNDILLWEGWEQALIDTINLKSENVKVGVAMPALMKETGNAVEALGYKKEDINLKMNAGKFGFGAEFGSLWMCKKELLDELVKKDGFVFDENFKLGMGEDRDLWDRVRLLGYDTCRTHHTRVFHQGNMTIGKVANRKEYTTKNRAYLEEKREKRNNNLK